MYDIYDLPKSIPLGRQGEQYARAVEIDCAKMLHDYPGARLTLMQRRTRGETARIVKADVSDAGVITWSPDMDAMAVAGLGAIEIVAMVGDKVAKSVIAATAIAPSLTPPDTDTQSGWVKDVLDASDAAQGAMAAAQESAAAAAGSAAAAQSSANAAAGSASAAAQSATGAAGSADAASKSAGDAAQSASDAAASAKAAAGSAADAAGALDNVNASADAAAKAARAAAESAKDASASKSGAAQSATAAAGSADAASGSAGDAAQSASDADASAKAAAESKTGAESAANAAKSEADKAAASAAAADTSEQAAAGSAAAAAESAQGAADAAKVEAAKIIQDGEIARTSTWSSQRIADQLYSEVSANGNPAVIENALEGYPMSIRASWEPIQEGEGEPSPDNIRPIKGRNNVKITRKNETQEDSITLTLPNIIYGSEVDVETGIGYKKWEGIEFNGTEKWQIRQVIGTHSYTVSLKSRSLQGICSHYAMLTYADVGSSTVAGKIGCYLNYSLSAVFNVPFASLEDWKSYLAAQYAAGTPVRIAYKRDAPESFTATGGGRIDALAGTNTIATDVDSLEIKTRAASKFADTATGIVDDTVITEGKAWSSKNTAKKLLPMQTVTGNPAVIETLEGYPLELNVSWEPKQDGSGTPSPDNVRAIAGKNAINLQKSGANMLNPDKISKNVISAYDLTIEYIGANMIRIKGLYNQDDARSFRILRTNYQILGGRGLKIIEKMTGGTYLAHKLYGLSSGDKTSIALLTDAKDWAPGTAVDMTIKIGVYAPEAALTEYQPYNGQDLSLTLPRTIYGGKIDPATGEGQETWGYIASYAGETLPGEWISDRDEYAAGATPTVGAQVAYKLATPVPFTATGGQTMLALAGTNVIITDADTLTATAPTPPQTTASAAEAQAAKLDYVAMMADVDVDDLTAVDDAGGDSGMDMPTDIEGSETDGKQEI